MCICVDCRCIQTPPPPPTVLLSPSSQLLSSMILTTNNMTSWLLLGFINFIKGGSFFKWFLVFIVLLKTTAKHPEMYILFVWQLFQKWVQSGWFRDWSKGSTSSSTLNMNKKNNSLPKKISSSTSFTTWKKHRTSTEINTSTKWRNMHFLRIQIEKVWIILCAQQWAVNF